LLRRSLPASRSAGVYNIVTVLEIDGKISLKTNPGYPTLLQTSREAQFEAARLDRVSWVPLSAGNVEVYINFDKEEVWLHDRFWWFGTYSQLHENVGPVLAKEPRCWESGAQEDDDDWEPQNITSRWVRRRRVGASK
jgi:hypothetical protein